MFNNSCEPYNGKKITVSRKKAKKLTVNHKKTRILTVHRKSQYPIETLFKSNLCSNERELVSVREFSFS